MQMQKMMKKMSKKGGYGQINEGNARSNERRISRKISSLEICLLGQQLIAHFFNFKISLNFRIYRLIWRLYCASHRFYCNILCFLRFFLIYSFPFCKTGVKIAQLEMVPKIVFVAVDAIFRLNE